MLAKSLTSDGEFLFTIRGLGKKDVSDHSLCGSLCEEAIPLIGVNSKNLIRVVFIQMAAAVYLIN